MREVRRGPFGRTVEAIVEVSAYEPDRRFDLRVVSGPLPIDGSHEFHEREGGTLIAFVAQGQPGGALRLAESVLARVLRRQFTGYYKRLTEILESRGPE
jgi:hypothetical protein